MESFITKRYKSEIFSSIILILLGLLLIFKSEATIITISYVVGSIIIAMGALAFITYFTEGDGPRGFSLAYGLICVILGILIITNPKAISSIIPIIIGIGVIINSALKLQYSLELKKVDNKMWMTTFIVALISTLCGVVILFNPFEGAIVITQLIGGFLVFYAIVDVICAYNIRKEAKNIVEELDVSVYDAKVVKEKKNKRKKKKEE